MTGALMSGGSACEGGSGGVSGMMDASASGVNVSEKAFLTLSIETNLFSVDVHSEQFWCTPENPIKTRVGRCKCSLDRIISYKYMNPSRNIQRYCNRNRLRGAMVRGQQRPESCGVKRSIRIRLVDKSQRLSWKCQSGARGVT